MLLSTFFTSLANAGNVCFDMEVGDHHGNWEWWWGDDEVHEDTSCNVCASLVDSQGRHRTMRCRDGIRNDPNMECIPFGSAWEIQGKYDVHVMTTCDDAMWIDRFMVADKQPGKSGPRMKWYGANNDQGWCLSTDKNDYKGWNNDDFAQHVSANACYRTFILSKNNHDVYGSSRFGRRRVDETELPGLPVANEDLKRRLPEAVLEPSDSQGFEDLSPEEQRKIQQILESLMESDSQGFEDLSPEEQRLIQQILDSEGGFDPFEMLEDEEEDDLVLLSNGEEQDAEQEGYGSGYGFEDEEDMVLLSTDGDDQDGELLAPLDG